jgi:uncharacterized membrane protein YfcA
MTEITLIGWLSAGVAAGIVGFSKSGLKGIGVIIVTIMALVFGSRATTGILLPLLIVGDVLAVIYYRRHVQIGLLFKLLPWMMLGVVIGAVIGKDLPEQIFKQGMAVIILFSVGMMYLWDKKKNKTIPSNWWFAGIMGLLAGITTMIGNLAGAFANVFFLAMRLPKNQFIGTTAWLFFIVNLFKMPFHIWSWETITTETLMIDVKLALCTIVGFFLGVRVIAMIQNDFYRKMILILTAIGALLIFL